MQHKLYGGDEQASLHAIAQNSKPTLHLTALTPALALAYDHATSMSGYAQHHLHLEATS
jgi:hypothetical protein